MGTNMAKKQDRRIVRTRAAIRDAFLKLLTEMDYSKITITMLARKADIDRKTFYTHYSSIDDLAEDIIRQIAHETFADVELTDFFRDVKSYTHRLLFELNNAMGLSMDEKRQAVSNIPVDKYLMFWTDVAKEDILAQAGKVSKLTEDYINVLLNFYLGGIVNTVILWIQSDSSLSLEQMADVLNESIASGLSGVLNKHVSGAIG